jgi:hypothetical protein
VKQYAENKFVGHSSLNLLKRKERKKYVAKNTMINENDCGIFKNFPKLLEVFC